MQNAKSYLFPNIAIEMTRHGDNLQTLSKKLGMSYQTLSARLRGERSFELPEIHKLMEIYKKDFETLFTKQQISVRSGNRTI